MNHPARPSTFKHFRSVSLLLLTLGLAACSQSELQSQVPSAVLNKQATGLTAMFSTSSTWDGGFNGLITLTNNTTSAVSTWTLNFKFNGNAGLSGTPWGAGGNAVKNADGSYTITPNSWGGNNIPAGGSVTVSYSGTGTFSGVTACTINNQSCSGGTVTDTTAPTASLTASPSTLTAAGSVTLNATATDNVGVTKVEFYRNGTLINTDTTAPYSHADAFSSSAQNGSYSYTAKSYDAAGNTKTSAAVTATVNIPGSGDTTAPTVSATVSPASLTAAGSVKVTANATDNVGVTKVEFYKGTTLVGTDTTAPYEYSESFSSSAQNGSYSYTAKAFDAAGNNATSAATTVTVNLPTGPVAGTEYAPYFYTWGWGNTTDYLFGSLADMKTKTGLNGATLAFVIAPYGSCSITTDGSVNRIEGDMKNDIAAFKASGGQLKVSFGGANGTYLESDVACKTVDQLYAALKGFVDRTGLTDLDFDVEQAAEMTDAINSKRAQALARLQASNPNVKVSFTLAAVPMDRWNTPGGLPAAGLNVVKSALTAGVKINKVNLMTMDFGSYYSGGRTMADASISAVEETFKQLKALLPTKTDAEVYKMLGATPMIGQNDIASEIFTLQDARDLTTWARGKGLGLVSFWAIQRDQPCKNGAGLAICSMQNTAPYQYHNIFKGVL
ncbi:Ig-like domain-containing protein [Deinococcus misasensis]|uniref:Ig-like domain-containing protein n=1 Tax=Deinococcus misasensis TaxID=392413 RepID=UPI001FE018C5|nr:Ig-like domain-containing protein [Deinococcus misasensis]